MENYNENYEKEKVVNLYRLCFIVFCYFFSIVLLINNNNKYYQPVSKNASNETKQVLKYLQSIYNKKSLAAQQVGDGTELTFIEKNTGKLPAIVGFDMMQQTKGWHDSAIDQAIKWHTENNGLVQFCWHWFPPVGINGEKRGSFYNTDHLFNVTNSVIPGTDEYNYIVRDINSIARQFKKLEENHVTVLWRPLHESGGIWFWWNSAGPEIYKELWYLIYDIFENQYNLNNIIWVWSGYPDLPEWYVGDDYCDIIGMDIYYQKDKPKVSFDYYVSDDQFIKMNYYYKNKIIALTETDQLPDPDNMQEKKANWLFIMPWYGDFIKNEKFNEIYMINYYYNHNFIITLDKIPKFKHNYSN